VEVEPGHVEAWSLRLHGRDAGQGAHGERNGKDLSFQRVLLWVMGVVANFRPTDAACERRRSLRS
jgi:hypothetical protein